MSKVHQFAWFCVSLGLMLLMFGFIAGAGLIGIGIMLRVEVLEADKIRVADACRKEPMTNLDKFKELLGRTPGRCVVEQDKDGTNLVIGDVPDLILIPDTGSDIRKEWDYMRTLAISRNLADALVGVCEAAVEHIERDCVDSHLKLYGSVKTFDEALKREVR